MPEPTQSHAAFSCDCHLHEHQVCDVCQGVESATPSREERFEGAMRQMREEVAEWLDLLDDGFKPPELKVGLPRSVTAAAWELGLAWAVLTEEPK